MALPAVGVIGTGAMGLGVVRSLLRQGARVEVRDIDPAAERRAVALGARAHASPAALARAVTCVIVLVADAEQVDEVCFGSEGLAGSMQPRAPLVLCSTLDPGYVAELDSRLGAHGVTLVDAPVSGGPARAACGTMTMMLAGPAEVLATLEPVFAAMSGTRFVAGAVPGRAATFKVVNNLLAAANLAAGAEALALAIRAGLDPREVLSVISASSGASWMVADRMPRALDGDRTVNAACRILAKDAKLAVALADRLGADAPFARAAAERFRQALAAGLAEDDDSRLLDLSTGVVPLQQR